MRKFKYCMAGKLCSSGKFIGRVVWSMKEAIEKRKKRVKSVNCPTSTARSAQDNVIIDIRWKRGSGRFQ